MKRYLFWMGLVLLFSACRSDEVFYDVEEVHEVTYPVPDAKVTGFYLLNEGNMGMNRASIDFFDYTTGMYHRNIYPSRNPTIVKELGDVGNDIQVYRNRLYAIINVSNYLEVMDLSGRHIKSIEIPNCRYIIFKGDKAYVSSYATPVSIDPTAGRGLVFELDLHSLELTRKVEVGYQPEEMVIRKNRLYVANSGGYRVPNYDHTISVIDLDSFEELKQIDVAINLHRMELDSRGDIYVSSRGDYYHIHSNLFVIDGETEEVVHTFDLPVGNMTMVGDSLYYYSVERSYLTNSNEISYGIIDTKTRKKVSDKVITDGTEKQIKIPYGLSVNPETKEIFITDAQNYVVTGLLYCFNSKGEFQWKTWAGNIPAHLTFIGQEELVTPFN